MNSTDVSKLSDKKFKIKKLEYNTYDIVHPTVKGQLRMLVVPKNFAAHPLQPGQKGLPQFGVLSQTIVGFTNGASKMTRTPYIPQDKIPESQKTDITTFVENLNEPWNEFILEGNILIRLKAVLTKVTWFNSQVTNFGDPSLWAHSSINMEAFENKLGDAGLQ